MSKIDIAGLDKAAVLAALHNHTRAIGMGRLHDIGRDMTVEEAKSLLVKGDDATRMFDKTPRLSFDYLCGRPLKVDLSGDAFDPWLYDRDAGEGQAAKAVASVRDAVHA